MLTYWIAFIFGSCLASFINTMVWRYGLIHQHPAGMFSHCDACQSRLKFWQLIPIWGWLLQKGRCFFCHSKLDPWMPLCETIFGCLTANVFLSTGPFWKIDLVLLGNVCLLVIACQDHYDHESSWTWLGGILPLISLRPNWDSWPIDILLVISLLFFYSSDKLGNGDCDLLVLMVAILGSPDACLAIMVACLLAACHPALYRHQEIAFVPCLSFALAGSMLLRLLTL